MSSTISLVFVVIALLATLAVLAIVLRRSSERERARSAAEGQASLANTAETQRRSDEAMKEADQVRAHAQTDAAAKTKEKDILEIK